MSHEDLKNTIESINEDDLNIDHISSSNYGNERIINNPNDELFDYNDEIRPFDFVSYSEKGIEKRGRVLDILDHGHVETEMHGHKIKINSSKHPMVVMKSYDLSDGAYYEDGQIKCWPMKKVMRVSEEEEKAFKAAIEETATADQMESNQPTDLVYDDLNDELDQDDEDDEKSSLINQLNKKLNHADIKTMSKSELGEISSLIIKIANIKSCEDVKHGYSIQDIFEDLEDIEENDYDNIDELDDVHFQEKSKKSRVTPL
jgi:hypothetical protein